MSNETKPEALSLGNVSDPATSGLPAWTRGFTLRRETDGRLFAVGQLDGANVYVQPLGWKDFKMTNETKGDAAQNFGVNVPSMHQQMNGTLQTNDPSFGPAAFGGGATSATAQAECRAVPAPEGRDYLIPGAIVVAAIVVALARMFRRG